MFSIKKIISLIGLSSILMANPINNVSNSINNSFSTNKIGGELNQKIQQTKSYQSLIQALKLVPSGRNYFYLGILYLNGTKKPDSFGKIVKSNLNKSLFYFKKSIEYGYKDAAAILGGLFLYHTKFKSLPNSSQEAIKYLKIAVDKYSNYKASSILAQALMNVGQYKEAIKYLQLGAEHKNASAQLLLAIMYNWGYKDKNNNIILKSDRMAANYLLSEACSNPLAGQNVKDFCNSKYIKKHNQK